MLSSPRCPHCQAELELGTSGKVDAWTCPEGHGVGFTLSEAHEPIQEDELSRVWHASEGARLSAHTCAMCERRMVTVTVGVDADEAEEGEPGDARDTNQVTLEVCRDDQFIWFDPGDLDAFPEDLPEPEPSADQVEQVDRIRKAYSSELDDAYDDDSPLGRFADRVAARHPGFVKFLDRVVYRDALDESHAA